MIRRSYWFSIENILVLATFLAAFSVEGVVFVAATVPKASGNIFSQNGLGEGVPGTTSTDLASSSRKGSKTVKFVDIDESEAAERREARQGRRKSSRERPRPPTSGSSRRTPTAAFYSDGSCSPQKSRPGKTRSSSRAVVPPNMNPLEFVQFRQGLIDRERRLGGVPAADDWDRLLPGCHKGKTLDGMFFGPFFGPADGRRARREDRGREEGAAGGSRIAAFLRSVKSSFKKGRERKRDGVGGEQRGWGGRGSSGSAVGGEKRGAENQVAPKGVEEVRRRGPRAVSRETHDLVNAEDQTWIIPAESKLSMAKRGSASTSAGSSSPVKPGRRSDRRLQSDLLRI